MAKFFGKIGYVETQETTPGVWEEIATERDAYGDVIRRSRRWVPVTKVNDDLDVNNEISIVADHYALNHFHSIRYVVWSDVCWKVSSVEVDHPRLILDIGGVYNGERPQT